MLDPRYCFFALCGRQEVCQNDDDDDDGRENKYIRKAWQRLLLRQMIRDGDMSEIPVVNDIQECIIGAKFAD